jgi:hypothetical protein
MSLLLNRIARMAARRIVLDRRARNGVTNTARGVADEVKTIAGDTDPARAAGRSFRRVLNKLSEREGPEDQSKQ